MPALEATEYERFSYDEAGQQALTLDEAVTKAKDLRRKDRNSFYRIDWADEARNTFIVKKIPVSSVYADFLAHVTKMMGRYVVRARRK